MAADGYAVMPVCQIMIILTGTDENLSAEAPDAGPADPNIQRRYS